MIKLNTTPAQQDFDAYNAYDGIIINDTDYYLQNDSGREMELAVYLQCDGALAGKRFTAGAAVTIEAWIKNSLVTSFSGLPIRNKIVSWTEPNPSVTRVVVLKDILLPNGFTFFLTASSNNANDTDVRFNDICIFDVSSSVISRSASGLPDVNVEESLGSTPLGTADILAQLLAAFDTAIPGSPTADSVNQRIKALDDLAQASGDGDLAAIKTAIDGLAAGDLAAVRTAVKILTNKAVQNKNTGKVDFYDDDGETIIFTHTPTDSESEIIRTPS